MVEGLRSGPAHPNLTAAQIETTRREKRATIEFTAQVREGLIEVPEEYIETLKDVETVKITVTQKSPTAATGIIGRLIANPIKVKEFVPLTREEAHARE